MTAMEGSAWLCRLPSFPVKQVGRQCSGASALDDEVPRNSLLSLMIVSTNLQQV